MILGFLGKGGSGKSSVATQTALWLHQQDNHVLGIDADHNMDLAYNLFSGSIPDDMPYFGDNLGTIEEYLGIKPEEKYTKIFFQETNKAFSFNPCDEITEKISLAANDSLRIMAAGPQTDAVLYGKSCSHILTTPLKVYLPLLELSDNQYVVVDEKAGADGVTTGIITGIDVGVIVCEPALHSIKTAQQIASLMEFYETPYIFVGNKIQSSEDREFMTESLGQEPAVHLLESSGIKRNPGSFVDEWNDELATIISTTVTLSQNNRLERTVKKFNRNLGFKQTC